jgi:hypothetical protein
MWDEIAGGSSGWSGPNERTAAVDAALVRIVRALDATALHHDGKRPKRVELVIDSSAQSTLEFEVGNNGRWNLEEGSWVDEGRVQRARLLRPVIRGVARATRPDFVEALDALVRDVEVACAARIAIDSEHDPAVQVARGQVIGQLLEAVFPTLSADDRAALREVTVAVELGAGTTMLVEGTTGDDMLFLLGGKIAVETRAGVVRLGPGSVVGERSPLTGRPRDASVRAITDVVVLVLHAGDMEKLPPTVIDALGSKVPV